MKKILILISAVMMTLSASAEGYQVNTLSARQFGMGHTGVALKLGAESLWFNPAAAAFQDSRFDISAGITGIKATATFSQNNYVDPVKTYTSDNDLSTPMFVYANLKVSDDMSVGVSFNTPFGSSMNWGDNWVGAHLVQNISLSAYSLQPTVSYKLLNDKLSFGAGLMMSWGTFDLSRSLFSVGESTNNTVAAMLTGAGMGQYAPVITAVGNNPLVSAHLGGSAGLRVGFNVGAMYNINERWTLGASYRSKMTMKVDSGNAQLKYASSDVEKILDATGAVPALDEGTFAAELPLPSTFSFGASFRPSTAWEFTTEFQLVGWSAYKNLNVSFNEPELHIEDINSVKNYDNAMMVRVGTKYVANEWLTARVGLYVDESPVRSDYMNPETPSMTKIGYTCGLSLLPTKSRNLSLDLSYGYLCSADPERMGSYPIDNAFTSQVESFTGNYTTHAHVFSFGIGFKF